MHNLVKESTGIDFGELGNDLKVAKEATLKTLGVDLDHKDKVSIEACTSIGHLLNEVDLNLQSTVLDLGFIRRLISLLSYPSDGRLLI